MDTASWTWVERLSWIVAIVMGMTWLYEKIGVDVMHVQMPEWLAIVPPLAFLSLVVYLPIAFRRTRAGTAKIAQALLERTASPGRIPNP